MADSPRLNRYVSGSRQRVGWQKSATGVSSNLGNEFSFWKFPGNPGPGVTPTGGSGAASTVATVGSLPFTAPTHQLYLDHVFVAFGRGQHLVSLYDRVWACSGLNANTLSAQSVNSVAFSRTGDSLWIEVYTQAGASAVSTATVSYSNQAGTPGRTATATIGTGTMAAGRMLRFQLQHGDTGITAIASFQLADLQGSGSDWGLTAGLELDEIQGGLDGVGARKTWFDMGGVAVASNACLALRCVIGSSGTMGDGQGSIGIVDCEL